MKDAFGGLMNVLFISIFLVIIIGILSLVVNYTKAFRMKNTVISYFERYEAGGNCQKNTECFQKIVEQAKSIGYSQKNPLHCKADFVNVENYFCYKRADNKVGVYIIETQVDINLPIINKIAGFSFLKVTGETRVIQTMSR